MLIAYLSLTGNVREFVEKTGMKSVEINYSDPCEEMDEPFIVIVPSYDEQITEVISSFVDYQMNRSHLIGFVGSGNLNFDGDYCFNAKDLSKKYNKPLLYTFEFSGTNNDLLNFKEELNHYAGTGIK
ncbi:ribonucleotide reductase stimulatory protein [Alkalihalobacillus alcalophilus ATCC 27647 = CGMCC 1.3604]|uniref:Ribonucleotide reductase stimulatory protein n=1 Tax=Alkalihalobacillus alcalophilus ATCC 27647 = CGMCC 1.3604 TaxID=1218173 RepID=A0A094WJB7_ALKAL|nr:class Ib ribonucleoside-diphosphate reductase assembly flavoprotein NrdI [Alkalihalobacillus alcalophilus]KGA96931.1 ribonucleotide reductase stimulatory protein [Alkalihalobacillus alcalophilus ATCC 27647 = CGMCC 1.3604]MED1562285.1 class Ib ribonucleoside-diphosphate reductase assembly flavoprotein NrdI [Alkalihalobacillus alcalophilus]THG88812.1 ribonucleotide reductase stimulatory protein [Alkalihalobacillus alcalophilus ATCC 27647 = CGMCC 1.3604]